MAYKIFISYSTKDFAAVEYIRKLLAQPSVEVFIAEYSVSPGGALAEQIKTAIRGCDLFVLVWSRNSRSSEWVSQEIGIAEERGKTIIPIVLEPGLELPGFIKDRKYLAVYQNPMAQLEWLRQDVLERAQKQAQVNAALLGLGLGALVFWLTKGGAG